MGVSLRVTQPPFPQGTYLLFDDDCGICTKFSHWFKHLLGRRADLVPMHIPEVETMGMTRIPDSYWTSFHVVIQGRWTTEGDAIIALAGLFPLGGLWSKLVSISPVHQFLMFVLRRMQATRKAECTIDLSS